MPPSRRLGFLALVASIIAILAACPGPAPDRPAVLKRPFRGSGSLDCLAMQKIGTQKNE